MKNSSHSRTATTLRVVLAAVGLAGAAALITNQALSQDKGAKPGQPQQPSAEGAAKMMEMMKQWQRIATPGPSHKLLDHFVGTWDLETRMWMGGPGSPVSESQATSEVAWILGERFLIEKLTGRFPMPGPTGEMQMVTFEGMGLSGYDNYKNMYVGMWADNMGTQLLSTKGAYNPQKKVFTLYGEMDEPTLGVHGRLVKYITRIVSKDMHVMEMHDLHAGDGYKVMEITYTRKK